MSNEGKTRIQITISAETREKLDAVCAQFGISKSAAAAIALNDWMKKVTDENLAAR